MTAGIAPPARTAAVQRSSASRLCGDGSPRWEKIVDSSATIGRPSSIATRTSSEKTGVNTPPGYAFMSRSTRPPMSQTAVCGRLAHRKPSERPTDEPNRRMRSPRSSQTDGTCPPMSQTAAVRSPRSSLGGTGSRQKAPTKAPSGLPLLTTPGYCSIVIASASTVPSTVKVSTSGFGPKMPSEMTSPPSTTPQSW